ncbi:arsenate reductase/protein-tyrosine-phosphatase family protein [Flavilitoribacter nigricans]|uniref:Phosphotyrosine protein phosphatase I domain-containing protein n=1 Tax=Flavilitoribacter nigricans (strain ATCC 23147 / DSM 23189 / NBRC 102662 / NCIMB 1420 / SS-2) TaxID=1122177 RepID=A0A2D0NJ47_FLAN2|nr:hypothetical protein [Flavilitoribacter nigricans]PHN08524.1 hypothetical protein CRP01_01020 [Flavilitoribacter nigricans DSM 23189 = NBRC 102662]
MKKILILCHYNTARSQMAEGYLKFFAGNLALVHSAGVENKNLHPLAFEIMDEDNIDIKEQHPKLATKLLKNKYDYLITFGQDIPSALLKQVRAKKHLHLDVDDPTLSTLDMEESFRNVRETIKKFILKFIGQELMDPVTT